MGGLLVMFACFRLYCQFLSPEFPSLNLGYPIVWYKESGGLRRPRRLRGWSDTSSSSPSRVCESCVSCDGPWHQLHSFILETTVLRPGSISEANFCCCWGREILRQKDFWQRKNGLVLPKAVENHWLVRLIQDVPLSITKHVEKMIQFRKVTSIPALKINCPASLVMLMQKQLLLAFCIKSVLLHSFDSLCRMAEMSTDQGPKSPHTKSHYTRKPPTCALLLLARLTSFHSKIIGKICCVPTSTPAAHANFLCSNPWEHVVLKASQWIRQSGINDTYHHSRPGLKATMASVWHWDFRAY